MTAYEELGAMELLAVFLGDAEKKFVLASSFGLEDQVLTHMVRAVNRSTGIFTIDTLRLFPETLALKEEMERRYGFRYKVYYPDERSVLEFERNRGRDSIYDSVENRKRCCFIRKIEPLGRALTGVDGWITGIRREQSEERATTSKVEIDEARGGLLKINPLADWSSDDVRDYIRQNDIPCNPLHDKGYASIGCEPCTRALKPGEECRAGRWWWERDEKKECGLHLDAIKTAEPQPKF